MEDPTVTCVRTLHSLFESALLPRFMANKFPVMEGTCHLPDEISDMACAGIFGASANGADMTSGCQSTGCNFLQPNDWMCFSMPFAMKCGPTYTLAIQLHPTACMQPVTHWVSEAWGRVFPCSGHLTPWNYLTVQLNRLSADDAGDPDLYGMFYGGSQVCMGRPWHMPCSFPTGHLDGPS